jgi:hypothetical protein
LPSNFDRFYIARGLHEIRQLVQVLGLQDLLEDLVCSFDNDLLLLLLQHLELLDVIQVDVVLFLDHLDHLLGELSGQVLRLPALILHVVWVFLLKLLLLFFIVGLMVILLFIIAIALSFFFVTMPHELELLFLGISFYLRLLEICKDLIILNVSMLLSSDRSPRVITSIIIEVLFFCFLLVVQQILLVLEVSLDGFNSPLSDPDFRLFEWCAIAVDLLKFFEIFD